MLHTNPCNHLSLNSLTFPLLGLLTRFGRAKLHGAAFRATAANHHRPCVEGVGFMVIVQRVYIDRVQGFWA